MLKQGLMTDGTKILVIGAGIAGAAACYWLRRYGLSPTLIEKFPGIRTGGQPLDIRGVAIIKYGEQRSWPRIHSL